jgi:L-asparaginase/Glu-tRNA(Gln) amidotransferase subunit D
LTRIAVGMEGIAAFGLAANVLQVVDFAQRLLSAGRQIYQAGSTVEHDELQVAVKDFKVLNNRLKTWARPDTSALGPLTEDGQVRFVTNSRVAAPN